MNELWTVEFHLCMRDFNNDTPALDGELIVRGNDIFDVLDKAKNRLAELGFDYIEINRADRTDYEKKGE